VDGLWENAAGRTQGVDVKRSFTTIYCYRDCAILRESPPSMKDA